MSLSPKERLLDTLQKKSVDRPPVVCTGGMMNAAIVDVMTRTGHTLPGAHFDAELMAELSRDVQEETGFENFGIPFCMTVEAEVLGSEINFGTLECEPKIEKEIFSSVSTVVCKDIRRMLDAGRIKSVAAAGHHLAKTYPDLPVIGSLTGPVSTAAAIVDPMQFLKELRKDRENAHRVMAYVSDFLIAFGQLLAENGASAICIGDPTATGEIIGPRMFEEYAVQYLNKVIDGIHATGVPVILHICGDMKSVKPLLPALHADALSTDAMVNLKLLKEEFPMLTTMGNVSTYLLEFGDQEKVARQTGNLILDGVDIISPACGLSTSTSLANINALTATVKERH
jgi:MtaA/CmuA family methyltransferase